MKKHIVLSVTALLLVFTLVLSVTLAGCQPTYTLYSSTAPPSESSSASGQSESVQETESESDPEAVIADASPKAPPEDLTAARGEGADLTPLVRQVVESAVENTEDGDLTDIVFDMLAAHGLPVCSYGRDMVNGGVVADFFASDETPLEVTVYEAGDGCVYCRTVIRTADGWKLLWRYFGITDGKAEYNEDLRDQYDVRYDAGNGTMLIAYDGMDTESGICYERYRVTPMPDEAQAANMKYVRPIGDPFSSLLSYGWDIAAGVTEGPVWYSAVLQLWEFANTDAVANGDSFQSLYSVDEFDGYIVPAEDAQRVLSVFFGMDAETADTALLSDGSCTYADGSYTMPPDYGYGAFPQYDVTAVAENADGSLALSIARFDPNTGDTVDAGVLTVLPTEDGLWRYLSFVTE